MVADREIATLIVESLASQIASFPEQALADCGCSPSLVAGVKAARDAFHACVPESEVEALRHRIEDDVRIGLAALDAARSKG